MEQESTQEIKISQRPVVRWTLMLAGTIFVGIGILGIFLPLLPTTVFFLLAAWCYARSSQKYYLWLHHNKYFGKYLKNYREGRGVTRSVKISTIIILWCGILYSMFTVMDHLWVKGILFIIGVGVTIHIIVIPTYNPQQ